MNRIFNIGDLSIDLGNIKNIRTISFSGGGGGCHVIIELLRGKEYVYNPDTLGYDVFEPQIKEGFGRIESAHFFIDEIIKEWQKYLDLKESFLSDGN